MPSDLSQTLERATAVLDCFAADAPRLGVREVARRTGMSPSAAGRLMQAMRGLGLLSQDPDTALYSIGARVLTWAGLYSAALDVRNLALPAMHELHRSTRETVSLYILDGRERLCIERLESPQNVRVVARVGRRLPLYAGSAGKVFLAFLPAARREEILAATHLEALTPNTITDPAALRTQLEQVRAQGYALSVGEWEADAAGIAAPIFDAAGNPAAAITLSGPAQRFTPAVFASYIPVITRTAQEISRQMGYRP